MAGQHTIRKTKKFIKKRSGGMASSKWGKSMRGVVASRKSNPSKKKAKKKSITKRISAALSTFLKKQNPAFKKARGVRVQKLKGGVIKFTPES